MIEHFGGWEQYKSVPTTFLERQITVWQARIEGKNQRNEEYNQELGV